ncbi:hypothetical protein SAMN04487866_11843 [Thermoactinomyces sp. DSM 45891]|uniref:Uncharacterized protein n=2 Tax=Thermoactinomycetaceae TaxID=186824 RepID=A0A4R2S5A0_9BACL|nr:MULTISPECIES: hypothetical protein [Thermoactinomycetaceae]MDQ0417120.1 hypothetical protein [Croceifilum oryzae]TCP66435.1 hypothetical protein EDD57_12414 [Baia soyae]SDZ17094.1 hypothetical protein SAMN05444416_11538 [Thermoactinomyces sp. DSM 45892]SFX69996.1 hypothetical protein SAMN04487866_11843 [Thermoactinomyces sp. DSM 45891]
MRDQIHALVDLLPEEDVETAYYLIRELLVQKRMDQMATQSLLHQLYKRQELSL